jgi:hypothetical protein
LDLEPEQATSGVALDDLDATATVGHLLLDTVDQAERIPLDCRAQRMRTWSSVLSALAGIALDACAGQPRVTTATLKLLNAAEHGGQAAQALIGDADKGSRGIGDVRGLLNKRRNGPVRSPSHRTGSG